MDRNCEICKHHSESGCSKWECQFEPTDSKHEVIEELEKIKQEIQSIIALADSRGEDSKLAYQCQTVINERISKLKGEQE